MIRITVIRVFRLVVTAVASIVALSCVAQAVNTFTAPNASLTTYSLNPGATKVLTPVTNQNVLVMAVCTDSASQGVAYVNLQRISASMIVWEGQHSFGNVTSGSSGVSGTVMATIDSGAGALKLEVSGTDKIQVHNTSSSVTKSGTVTLIW